MRFFTTQFELTYPTTIPSHIPYSKAVSALHDHGTFLDLSPPVTLKRRCNEDEVGEWLRREMGALKTNEGSDDSLDFWELHIPHPFGSWMGEIVLFSGFLDTPQGIKTLTEVPGAFGLRGRGTYTIEEKGSQGLLFVETHDIECPWGTRRIVENTHRKEHTIMQQWFVERLGKESETSKQGEPL